MSTGVWVGELVANAQAAELRGEVGEQGSDIGELWGEAGRYSGVETEEEEREWAASVTPKRRGEMAEAAFVAKASRMGFGVAKPWGDSDPYDFIVDTGEKLRKVQVKSAWCVGEDGATVSTRTGTRCEPMGRTRLMHCGLRGAGECMVRVSGEGDRAVAVAEAFSRQPEEEVEV